MIESNNDEVIFPNCVTQFRAIPVNVQTEIADLKEQLAQLRIEADFNFEQYQDAGRLMCDLQEIAEQQAEAIRLKDEALKYINRLDDDLDFLSQADYDVVSNALAIQPSPEILQARDERVAEACAKVVEPRSLNYITRGDALTAIRSGEWRRYL